MKLQRVQFVTSNDGKVAEFQAKLEPLGIKVEQKEIPYPEIQADSLEEVVQYGLAHLGETTTPRAGAYKGKDLSFEMGFEIRSGNDLPRFETKPGTAVAIEDSGLFVEALKGYPGVYSKPLFMSAGPEGLLRLMEPYPEHREAEFRSAIGLLLPNQETKVFCGRSPGVLGQELIGDGGFGFDPIFISNEQPETPYGDLRTFAEMTPEEKNSVSHRGKALEALVQWLR